MATLIREAAAVRAQSRLLPGESRDYRSLAEVLVPVP